MKQIYSRAGQLNLTFIIKRDKSGTKSGQKRDKYRAGQERDSLNDRAGQERDKSGTRVKQGNYKGCVYGSGGGYYIKKTKQIVWSNHFFTTVYPNFSDLLFIYSI